MVDLMRYFCGEAKDVKAISKYTDRDYETFTTAQIEFENGSSGILIAGPQCRTVGGKSGNARR